jgi:hypothetical protein
MRGIHRRRRHGRQRCGGFATDFAGKRAPTVDLRSAGIIRGGGRDAVVHSCRNRHAGMYASSDVAPECTHHSIATTIHCRSALAREDVGTGDRDSANSPQNSVRATGLRRAHRRLRDRRQRCGGFVADIGTRDKDAANSPSISRASALLQGFCVLSTLIDTTLSRTTFDGALISACW